MGLREYHAKRDFEITPEPEGHEVSTATGHSFVVQKHAARRLHYDVRLELDGVLLSWAVPKGPSLDPSERRLAVRTEDHPIEYGTFEGIIPKGEYGGGTVVVWDRGEWEPIGDPHEGLERGNLSFVLHGKKLHGRFRFVRTKSDWLLIKGRDERAQPGDGDRLVRDRPESVVSGRTVEDIARDPDRVWHGDRGDAERAPDAASSRGARCATLPAFIPPELATRVDEPPEGDAWIHEIKLDGYRILARLERGEVCLLTRKSHDWTARLPSIARVIGELPFERAWLDGELVVLGPRGATDFGALQMALGTGGSDASLRYVVFDLLHLDGLDLRAVPLLERKALLERALRHAGALEGRIRYGDHVRGGGGAFFQHACELGVEGIVSKRADRPYVERRTKDWLKVKCMAREECVVGGFTDPKGGRGGLGALLLGQHVDGELRYVGKVGTGFDTAMLAKLRAELDPKVTRKAPFVDAPRARGIHWVEPTMVVEVRYAERTKDGKLRHPCFIGVREDKPAKEVREEEVESVRNVTRSERGKGTKKIAGVALSNPERVLWSDLGITKSELATYYETIAPWILPHVADRPLTLVRCPEGFQGAADDAPPRQTGPRRGGCFYQKHGTPSMPRGIRTIAIEEKDGVENNVWIHDLSGLVGLAQIGTLEVHTWGSKIDDVERADRLVMDLDPGPGVPWEGVVTAAFELRDRLTELGLTSFVKTTGGKGLHVVIPITRRGDWDDTKAVCHAIALDLVRRAPRRYVATMTKSKRDKKIFVDYLRNARGATSIAAYSTRAKPGAPVSTPITWEELAAGARLEQFDVRTVPTRLASLTRDPWEGLRTKRQSITRAVREALGLRA
jgi:bifunctional non-homologous end joining protein LigD